MFITRSVARPPFRCKKKDIPYNNKGISDSKIGYYTTSQLAKRWGVSVMTIIRLIEQGDLRGLKIRGSYRINLTSIKEYEAKVAF